MAEGGDREAFRADPRRYLDRDALTAGQRQAIEDRDWPAMLRNGGNIYYTFKLAIFDGLSMQQVGGMMSGMTAEDFATMMIDGGRSPDGNRHIGEWEDA